MVARSICATVAWLVGAANALARPRISGAIINAARNSAPPIFQVPFRYPTGKITSPFGAVQMYNGDIFKSRHLGMDVAASLGAPVLFLVGGTVVVVHGAGIASVHFHFVDPAVFARLKLASPIGEKG